jgi:hypothetical protein
MRRGLSSYFRRLLYCIKQYSTVQQASSLATSPNLNVPLKDQPDFDVPMGNEGSCTSATNHHFHFIPYSFTLLAPSWSPSLLDGRGLISLSASG